MFVSQEDETGNVRVIVWPSAKEAQRKQLLASSLPAVRGRWQRRGEACSLIAQRVEDLTALLGELDMGSRDSR